ncbi:MAG: hypothetical protein FWF66_03975 [Candidatus Bathyarchaeota archaeon]|nr:hypothetical protein [Candidatus Termiticorpusculum sp.]
MKIEKRIITLCMCALALGIVATLPLTYFTPQTKATTQPIHTPWFTMNTSSAYINAYLDDNSFSNETIIFFHSQ